MESRARASGEQFATIVEYMERHGDLSKPQTGLQGRIRADQLWQELVNNLNAIGGGVTKTPEKWKKVWADWKSKTKKKALVIRQHASGTGGGPNIRATLSQLETRVLALMGALAVEGHAEIEEQGFDIPSVAPTHNLPEEIGIEYDITIEPQPPSSPPPTQLPQVPLFPSTSQQQLPISARPPPQSVAPTRTTSPPAGPENFTTSPVTTHRRRGTRRRLTQTPFDRATSEFVGVEQRRLRLEERRIEADEHRNQILSRFADIAEAFLQQYLQRDRINNE